MKVAQGHLNKKFHIGKGIINEFTSHKARKANFQSLKLTL
jgi:hypothetical protein